jgi:hypothetical protein
MDDVSHLLGNMQLGDQEDDDSGGVLGALLEFPAVLEAHVLSKLSCVDHFALAQVSRACRDKVYQLEPVACLQNLELEGFMGRQRFGKEYAVITAGRVDVLKFLCRDDSLRCLKDTAFSAGPSTRPCEIAAERGDLEMVKYLEGHDCPWDGSVCDAAALAGHLEVLQWLHGRGCPWNVPVRITETCESAAKGGHLEVLQWLLANGCPCDEGTCSAAAEEGHLEVLKWAHANGCPWDDYIILHAFAERGDLEMLQWAHAEGCELDVSTCSAAAAEGRFEVLQWLRANGCEWEARTCENAARGGHLEVLQWLRANGCPWTERTCEAAARAGHLEVFRWAHDNGCPDLRDWEQIAVAGGWMAYTDN